MKHKNQSFVKRKLTHMPDLSEESERQRLGPSAIKMVFAIITAWKLSDSQARGLLALGPEEALEQARTNPHTTLFTEERMFRFSYLLGIYKGLHIHWNSTLADQWIQLPNQNPIFGGLSPVEYMIRGGLDAMQRVRRLVDAWCAGN